MFFFHFLNDKIHNYVKQNIIINAIIQKLKNEKKTYSTVEANRELIRGAKYLVFVSSRSLKTRELSFAQFVYFLRKVCLFFNFWMIKFTIMYVLFDIIVNLIIQILKQTPFLQKYTNWAKLISLVLTEREETKTRYFAP